MARNCIKVSIRRVLQSGKSRPDSAFEVWEKVFVVEFPGRRISIGLVNGWFPLLRWVTESLDRAFFLCRNGKKSTCRREPWHTQVVEFK